MPAEPVVHRLAERSLVAEPSNDLVLKGLLAHGDSDADLSITWVQLSGHHRRLRTDASTRIYAVTQGTGTITVDATPIEVASGDVVVIPRGTPYHLDGAMTYLVANQPAFRDGDDIYLEPEGADAEVAATGTTPAADGT